MRAIGAAILCVLAAGAARAGEYELRILRGSVQLGGAFTAAVRGEALPEGARCVFEVPPPFDAHVAQVSDACDRIELTQKFTPILDGDGYAIPSEQVPATVRILGPDGAEIGLVDTMFPYHNQFTDLRILIKGVRNPVSEGESFEAVVQGAGQPIDPSLTCRWNTYGPVAFEPASENGCTGTVTALAPSGQDADMDVEIVNLTDMHAVGYATARMIVR